MCPTEPITHAFSQFKDNDERDNFVRSVNILKKEFRGRKIKISPAVDAEDVFQQKKNLDTSNAAITQDTMYQSCISK